MNIGYKILKSNNTLNIYSMIKKWNYSITYIIIIIIIIIILLLLLLHNNVYNSFNIKNNQKKPY